jgi:hypothetical protein
MNPDTMPELKYLQGRYQEGFIPGPGESFEAFQKRVDLIKSQTSNPKLFMKALGISFDTITPITSHFFSITTKKGLPFWIGAMTYLYEHEGITIPVLELPKKKRGFILSKEEILAHEKVHFLRSAFNEPRFEEILAYQTSISRLRKLISPLFQKTWESTLCIFLLLLLPIFPFIPLSMLALALTRLLRNQYLFKRAQTHLSLLYKNPTELLTLLTDREIITKSLPPSSSPRAHLFYLIAIKY